MSQSPEIAGGAGFSFEDAVVAQYLTALLVEGVAPGVSDRTVCRVALQQRDFGEPLDDLIVDFRAAGGEVARLSLQVKRALTISSAKTNTDFRDIVRDSWRTLKKPDFRDGIDRFGAATGSVAAEKARSLQELCEIARSSPAIVDFEARFTATGNASVALNDVKGDIFALIEEEIGGGCPPAELHRFLSHFVLLKFDHLHAGAIDPPQAINALRGALVAEQADRASLLLDRLCHLAREGAGRSEQFDRPSLVRAVAPVVQLRGAVSLRNDLDKVSAIARSSVQDIDDDVRGTRLERPKLEADLDVRLSQYRFIQIRGLPGAGKSVLLRRRVEAELDRGPVLFLKSDRLEGRCWAAFATAHGLTHAKLVDLLVELEAVGSNTLYIDGIDRIDRQHRAIVIDIIRVILQSPLLADWHVVVTLRDSGIEPLRTWLPAELFESQGVGGIEVGPLDDDEATVLASAQPALRPLLFGPKPVQEIVRRPFFAKILSQNFAAVSGNTEFAPQSEVDLIENWWVRGGYDAEGAEATIRQRALLDLGDYRARHLNEPIPISALSSGTTGVIDALKADGILHDVRLGHSLRFAHDIFFEWAFFHRLVDRREHWLEDLKAAGEPPVIGRVVELLSQSEFARGDDWGTILQQVEQSGMRSQWTRAWLLAPLTAPNFEALESRYVRAVERDNCRLLQRALVWFQAERTAPNARILDGTIGTGAMTRDERIRAADLLGWPSDFPTWSRLIAFLLRKVSTLPVFLVPDMVALFEVWQNALADLNNPISRALLVQSDAWLRDIERWDNPDRPTRPAEDSPWGAIRSNVKDLEKSLRRLLLRTSRAAPDLVEAYLDSSRSKERFLDRIFGEIMNFAVVLAETHPRLLTDLTLLHLKEELPDDRLARKRRDAQAAAERRAAASAKPPEERTRQDELILSHKFTHIGSSGYSMTDWENLAVDRDRTNYFPASPLREPFCSLFANAPEEALRLLRDLSNHAMAAWRQLHRLDHERRATPIPLEIDFPWGTQRFWGGRREYLWSRGIWAPKPLACAYLALENWALAEIERGRQADALIEQVMVDNECIAILGTAMVIALQTRTVSDAVQPLLASQRLWRADLERLVQEPSIRGSGLIGFNPGDVRHAEAVDAMNNRAVRQFELRDLVPSYVLSADSVRAEAMRSSILSFEDGLPFEFEEDQNVPQVRAQLADWAKTNVEWAHVKNFRLMRQPQDESQKVVVHLNPQAETPEAQARLAESREMFSEYRLFQWAETSFEKGIVSTDLAVSDAIALAKELDSLNLFDPRPTARDVGVRRGAVAGAAAVVLAFRSQAMPEDLSWARTIIARAVRTPEEKDALWTSVGIIPWHPCIFAARALAADLRGGDAGPSAAGELLGFVAHPLQCVSLAALGQLFALWDIKPRLAWCALSLGLALCHSTRERSGCGSSLFDPAHAQAARAATVRAAIDAYVLDDFWPELLPPPPAWVRVESAAPGEGQEIDGEDDDEGEFEELSAAAGQKCRWREPDALWYSQFAAKIIANVPIDRLMADAPSRERFLPFSTRLLTWTIEKIAPTWDRSRRRSDRYGADVFEWCDAFAEMLGQMAGGLDADKVASLYLDPICALDDEPCFSLLAPFVDIYIRVHVLDAAVVAASAERVLGRSLDRLLLASEFKRESYRAGELHGDMPLLAKSLLFVVVERAMGAARFVNGDWRELPVILPTIDRFVREAGWASAIMSNFLTLCERARDTYPASMFADQVLMVLALGQNDLADWRGTLIAARIAGLVHFFSERDAPLSADLGRRLLRILDSLVDLGDRRSAALQISAAFRDLRVA